MRFSGAFVCLIASSMMMASVYAASLANSMALSNSQGPIKLSSPLMASALSKRRKELLVERDVGNTASNAAGTQANNAGTSAGVAPTPKGEKDENEEEPDEEELDENEL